MNTASRVTNLESALVPVVGAADQSLAVSTSVVQLAAFQVECSYVLVQFIGADARVTFDDSAPTGSNGFLYTNGTMAVWSKQRAKVAKFIRDDTTDLVVQAQEMSS